MDQAIKFNITQNVRSGNAPHKYNIASSTLRAIDQNVSVVAGRTYNLNLYVEAIQDTTIRLRFANNIIILDKPILVSDGLIRIQLLILASETKTINFGFFDNSGNSGDMFYFGKAELADVTGATNQAAPEYIDSDINYGVGVNGVRYFNYENGNTVTDNIVTEAQGAAIPESTLRGFSSEEQRTNLVLQSQNHATTWTAVGTPTITSANKNYGALSLDLIGDDDALAVEGYKQNITFTGDAAKSCSTVIKKGTATKSVIRLRDTTSAADRLNVEVTWSGSAPVFNYVAGSEEFAAQALIDGSYRVRVLTGSVTAANTNSLEIYPATDNALAVLDTGNINVGGWQCENALKASSYIPTTTATVTRSADLISFPASNIDSTKGTFYAEIQTDWTGNPAASATLLGNGTSNQSSCFIATTDTPSAISVSDQTTTTSLPGLDDASTGIRKRVCSWGPVGQYSAGNGLVSGIGAFDNGMDMSSIVFGNATGGARALNGTMKNIKIYGKQHKPDKALRLLQ